MERGSGILLHISALPSKYGIGSFSKEAKQFVKTLKFAGQKYWQILPLNPTGFKDSPYQSNSCFALNPYFIDLDQLKKKHYLSEEEISEFSKSKNTGSVDFEFLYNNRYKLLEIAAKKALKVEKNKIDKFYNSQKFWLKDYACFMTLKKTTNNKPWNEFDIDLRKHKRDVIDKYIEKNLETFNIFVAIQYFAFQQYFKLKKYANSRGIYIIGDLPIYVSYDSCDVWGHQKEFLLNKDYKPSLVAGVPPDYFSEDGQLWGNPLYNYEKMEKNNFRWWSKRIKHASKLYDLIRIDHFRGFASYYTIPIDSVSAKNGTWKIGPREKIINVFKKYADGRIIAEDLGILTDDVYELMDYAKYPGINVLQFGLDGNMNHKYLPHMYSENAVAYLSTHDNDVMMHFLATNSDKKRLLCEYLNISQLSDGQIVDEAIKALMNSKANIVIFTPQDILHLDESTRFNVPGTDEGNWKFRFQKRQLKKELFYKLYDISCRSDRY